MLDQTLKALVRPWRLRRLYVAAVLAFCAGIITYLTVWGADTALQRDIASMAWFAVMSTTGSYVFGATWDDRDIRRRAIEAGRPDPQRGDGP